MRQSIVSVAVLIALSGCGANAPDAQVAPGKPASVATRRAPASPSTVATPPSSPAAALPAFVDTVWRAGTNTGVEAGSTYTFRRDGTLRMTAPHGTPSTGQWRYENGKLTMVEEGVAYPTDIVSQDATHLVLRSHNPGGSVEIVLVADAAPRP